MLKRFFYASAAVLMLALAYHFGASTASAQAPANPVAAAFLYATNNNLIAVTANGDAYISADFGANWTRRGNVFGTTPTIETSWGALKVKSR